MIRYGELEHILKNKCYVDFYKPKSGTEKEVTVINFHVTEDKCYEDLTKFIYYSSYDTLNIDMQPNPESDDYIVYIELYRTEEAFNNILKICRDFSNLNLCKVWDVHYYPDKVLSIPINKIDRGIDL